MNAYGTSVIAEFSKGRTTDDTDLALRIIYKDGQVAYSVTWDGTNFTLVGGGTTTTLAAATYTSLALLQAAIEAIPQWTCVVNGFPADLTSYLLQFTINSTGGQAGVPVYYDTSACYFRLMSLGLEEYQTLYALAAQTGGNIPWGTRDPDFYNTALNDQGTVFNGPVKVNLRYASAVATFGSGTMSWTIGMCDRTSLVQTALTFPGAATTVSSTPGLLSTGAGFIMTNPGQRLVCKYGNSGSNAITVSSISLLGDILGIN